MKKYDAIIVGAGAGGCAAAYQLVKAGWKVALVERGEVLIDYGVSHRESQAKEKWLNSSGNAFYPEEHFNVGGKTKWYGAALMPLSPTEFLPDLAHGCRGWPINYEDLHPYYEQAKEILGPQIFYCEPDLKVISSKFPARWHSEPLPLALDLRTGNFDGMTSPYKRDATAFLVPILNDNLTLFTNSVVSEIYPGAVVLKTGLMLFGRKIILAAGAMHSPRLLAQWEKQFLEKTDSENGRYVKKHLLTCMLGWSPGLKTDLVKKTQIYYNVMLPHSSVQPLGVSSEEIARSLPWWLPLKNYIASRCYGFFLQTEDGSDRDNCIRGNTFDYSDYRVRPAQIEHYKLIESFGEALQEAGCQVISKRIGLVGTAHICGSMIAGETSKDSVVDKNGKVWDEDDLYVVDGSVMSRIGRVNPSLTIMAWALRVADRLVKGEV